MGLRIGRFRVFYELDAVDSDLVNILAVGIKKGNRLFVALGNHPKPANDNHLKTGQR